MNCAFIHAKSSQSNNHQCNWPFWPITSHWYFLCSVTIIIIIHNGSSSYTTLHDIVHVPSSGLKADITHSDQQEQAPDWGCFPLDWPQNTSTRLSCNLELTGFSTHVQHTSNKTLEHVM